MGLYSNTNDPNSCSNVKSINFFRAAIAKWDTILSANAHKSPGWDFNCNVLPSALAMPAPPLFYAPTVLKKDYYHALRINGLTQILTGVDAELFVKNIGVKRNDRKTNGPSNP